MSIQGLRVQLGVTLSDTRVFTAEGDEITAQLALKKIEIKHEVGSLPVAVLVCLVGQLVENPESDWPQEDE